MMKNGMGILRILGILSIILFIVHIVYHDFSLFSQYGTLVEIMAFFDKFEFVRRPFLCKVFVGILAIIGTAGGNRVRKINITTHAVVFLICASCFIVSHLFCRPGIGYMVITGFCYVVCLFVSAVMGAYFLGTSFGDNAVKVNFRQCEKLIDNNDSINIPTRYVYNDKLHHGWINVVNPFRASLVLGTPGSGKSYSVYYHYIEQMIRKGYAMYLYDYKYPDLSKVAYNILLRYADSYPDKIRFYVINFDDPAKTNRANPLNPVFLNDIIDAYEAAYMVMINLNRSWVQKQGDFFVESAIVFFTAIIWYLKLYENGKYCTLPHAIELLMQKYESVFAMLKQKEEIKNYLAPFINAMEGGAQDQLQGQLASAQIPLTRLSSPAIYWAMSGDDFTLDINNPEEPKVVCIANNPDRQTIYAAALSLYNSRLFKIINKPGKHKCAVLLDELPTIYIKGLDNLIETARSNKVAIVAGAQDMSQIVRDYGDKEAKVILNTIGNVFSGNVKSETAKMLSENFGKIYVEKKSVSFSEDKNNNISLSNQLEDLIPASIISTLSQGTFVGNVADNYEQKIEQKNFHAEIVVNQELIANMKQFEEIPVLAECKNGSMEELIQQNYMKIKEDIKNMIYPYL